MPSSRRLLFFFTRYLFIAMPIIMLTGSLTFEPAIAISVAQSSEGDETLDEAFSMKLSAKSTRDLDKVVDLCEQAMEEGLDEEGEEQAKQLAAAALYEHAEQLSRPILVPNNRDRRWQIYRRQALSRLKKATEYQPKMGSAWLLITKLHGLPGGDPREAAVAVEKAIELAGDDRRQLSAALFLRARLAGNSGDADTLLADLDQAIKIDPENFDAYRVRGEYYLKQREPEKALEDLNRWLDSSRSTIGSILVVDGLIAMGDKFDDDMQQAALEILSKAIENDPKSPDPYFARARVHAILEDIDAALNDIDDAMKLAPNNEGLIRFRTQLLVGAERWDEAHEAIDAILEKNPDDEEMGNLRLALLIEQARYADAIDQLRKLIRLSPDNLGYRRQLAALYNAEGRPSQAIRVYSRLLDDVSTDRVESAGDQTRLGLLSTRSSLLQGRGNARLSTGEHKEAIEDYEESLELSYELRDLLEELDIDLALDRENSTLVGVLNNYAWVLATSPEDDLRDGKKAIELATEAAELTKFKEAYILSTLASGYAENGEFDTALEWIEKAITVNSETTKELTEKGDQEEAVKINKEQTESLKKEKASYVDKKPWREKQEVGSEEKADTEDKDAEDADDVQSDEDMDSSESDNNKKVPDDADEQSANDKADETESDSEPSDESADNSDDDPAETPAEENDTKDSDQEPKADQDSPDSDEPSGDNDTDAEPSDSDSGNDQEDSDSTPDTDDPDEEEPEKI